MLMRRVLGYCVAMFLSTAVLSAAGSELADAAMKGNKDAVRSLLKQGADVNGPQVDGATALHWAVKADDMETADLLISAGANVSAANRAGVIPLMLATLNGNAVMIDRLIKAGANPNAPLTLYGNTALMMAARTGKTDTIKTLLDNGAAINTKETWSGTTALMWAVSERHPAAVKMLLDRGADVHVRSKYLPPQTGRGYEGSEPIDRAAGTPPEQFASGELTPLLFAARDGDVESARLLIAAGADVNAIGGDGKDPLGLAIFNGSYDVASLLIDSKANVNHPDSQNFTPLFWAVDRRNVETPPNFPWMVTTDPLPLIKKLLAAGADPNFLVDNTPRARMREGDPRIVYATATMRAAFSGDLELVRLLLSAGANPFIVSKDNETTLMAAAGTGFIPGYSKGKSNAERLEVIKLLVDFGMDVNEADDYGITALMSAANLGDVPIIQYLIDVGANLGAYDFGKKNDGAFGASIEPLMPLDYAIGVGTFRPNNAVVYNEAAVELMTRLMKERGIQHTTSECSLRGFTCSTADVDPKTATPAQIQKMRRVQTGNHVDGVVGGLGIQDPDKK